MTAIDRAALRAARERPVIVALSSIVGFLSGANGASSTANNDYTQAGDTSTNAFNNAIGTSQKAYTGAGTSIGNYYQNALNNLLYAGQSPAAQEYGQMQEQALQPEFNDQDKALTASLAANGITGSGAGKADFSDLAARQSSTLAGVTAPLYQQGLADYANLNSAGAAAQSGNAEAGAGSTSSLAGAGAGARSNIAAQGAGASNTAYQNAISQFYQSLGSAGGAFGGAPAAATNPYGGVEPGVYDGGYILPTDQLAGQTAGANGAPY